MSNEYEQIIFDFLDKFHFIYPNLNDSFYYAAADSEKIYLDGESNQKMLVRMYSVFGFSGILAFVSVIRNRDPLKELQTEDYFAAKKYLELINWKYDED